LHDALPIFKISDGEMKWRLVSLRLWSVDSNSTLYQMLGSGEVTHLNGEAQHCATILKSNRIQIDARIFQSCDGLLEHVHIALHDDKLYVCPSGHLSIHQNAAIFAFDVLERLAK